VTNFDQLHPALQHHIVNSLGWRDLREVQELAIEGFHAGANLVILAPTAGGKTEAAFFPVISQTLTENWRGLSTLYVSPIKALLNNQAERLSRYFGLVGRRTGVWHGDTPAGEKRRLLQDPPDCLLTTPESLEAMLVSSRIDHQHLFQNVRVLVIDELHAFAGDDRGWHLLSVFARIQRLAQRDLQRVGLSATVGNPDEMLDWMASGSNRPRRSIKPVAPRKKPPDVQLDFVGSLENAAQVIHRLHQGEKRLVFCDSRARVEQLSVTLRELGTETFVSHSSLGGEERRAAESAFAQRKNCVIVSTSSLELGLDVGDLDRVIQIDAPSTVSSFLQRMGRTGRRTHTSTNCLFLATSDEGLLRSAAIIDLWKHGYVEPVQAPPHPYHILSQQLMALILQERGMGRHDWPRWIEPVPAFAAMSAAKRNELVESMLAKRIVWEDQGILAFAPEGEAIFGKQNFMDLLSVFTSPPLFVVMTGRKELGYVHESTFLKRDEGPTILVLAGRSWRTNHLDWKRRIAHVEPSESRGASRWLGAGQMLAQPICQGMRRVLSSEELPEEWSRRASQRIGEIRVEYPWFSDESTILLQESDGSVRWFTFAGGVANKLLADSLFPQLATATPPQADAGEAACGEVASGDVTKGEMTTGEATSGKATKPVIQPDNVSIRFLAPQDLGELERRIAALSAELIVPQVDSRVIEQLKFSECLSTELAEQVFKSRFRDPAAIEQALSEQRRLVVAPAASGALPKIDSTRTFPGSAKSYGASGNSAYPAPDAATIQALAGLRALSIRQPHAEAIMRGAKTEEYRSGPTKIRGRILIYASLGRADAEEEADLMDQYDMSEMKCDDLPRGALVGTVELYDCDEEAWQLRAPERLPQLIRPLKQPQPVWFWPF
jgi:ATP-dependent Lhr-like helicase